jgi:cytochrome c
MIKTRILATLAAVALAAPVLAEGDAASGETQFKKCKSCHMIANGDEILFKGGKTGPNLYGIVGGPVGAQEGFKYGTGLIALNEAGETWTEESLVAFIADPKKYVKEATGDSGVKTKMTFKLKKKGEDVAAFLATFGPAAE